MPGLYSSFQQLTKDINCSSSFCWSNFICHCTFVHWSIIFSHQLCQIKSLWCRQFAVVSLFGPCNVGLWITGGITEQDGSIAFNNLISWRSWVNCRGNWKTRTETQLELLHGILHVAVLDAPLLSLASNKNQVVKILDVQLHVIEYYTDLGQPSSIAPRSGCSELD